MCDETVKLLFESLARIMSNQQKIMRHLGITKFDSDYGHSDTQTEGLISDCYDTAKHYEHDD